MIFRGCNSLTIYTNCVQFVDYNLELFLGETIYRIFIKLKKNVLK